MEPDSEGEEFSKMADCNDTVFHLLLQNEKFNPNMMFYDDVCYTPD